MRGSRKLHLKQLDQKLSLFTEAGQHQRPPKGWINAIRTSLKMTLEQLGNKLGLTKQGARGIEQREASEALTLKACREVAEAMDMQFVYGFVPKAGSLQELVSQRARVLAQEIVMRTHQHMVMEAQGTSEQKLEESINELAEELEREMPRALWG